MFLHKLFHYDIIFLLAFHQLQTSKGTYGGRIGNSCLSIGRPGQKIGSGFNNCSRSKLSSASSHRFDTSLFVMCFSSSNCVRDLTDLSTSNFSSCFSNKYKFTNSSIRSARTFLSKCCFISGLSDSISTPWSTSYMLYEAMFVNA